MSNEDIAYDVYVLPSFPFTPTVTDHARASRTEFRVSSSAASLAETLTFCTVLHRRPRYAPSVRLLVDPFRRGVLRVRVGGGPYADRRNRSNMLGRVVNHGVRSNIFCSLGFCVNHPVVAGFCLFLVVRSAGTS